MEPIRISANSWHYRLYRKWHERNQLAYEWRRKALPDHRCSYGKIVVTEIVRTILSWFFKRRLCTVKRWFVYPWTLFLSTVAVLLALNGDSWRAGGMTTFILGAYLLISTLQMGLHDGEGAFFRRTLLASSALTFGFMTAVAGAQMSPTFVKAIVILGAIYLATYVIDIWNRSKARADHRVVVEEHQEGTSFRRIVWETLRSAWSNVCPRIELPPE